MTYIEILFKGNRFEYLSNTEKLELRPGTYVIVDVERGLDMGLVTRVNLSGERKKSKRSPTTITRIATQEEITKLFELRENEHKAFKLCKEKIKTRNLTMKLVDVEYQFDENKITFYFTADHRVDFRDLVKDLASVFKTRIELRQIGVRDEAKRLGGLGCCGRPLCCSTFLKTFQPVTLQIAREQHISLSPSKMSGVCGRLMCCLMYERDFYREANERFPNVGQKVTVIETNATVKVIELDLFNDMIRVRDEEKREIKLALSDINWDKDSLPMRLIKKALPKKEIKENKENKEKEIVDEKIIESKTDDWETNNKFAIEEEETVEETVEVTSENTETEKKEFKPRRKKKRKTTRRY